MNRLLFIFTLLIFSGCSEQSQGNILVRSGAAVSDLFKDNTQEVETRLQTKAEEALEFCKSENFSTDYAILIDMSIHSGKHRMFVYDFKNKKVERSSLCAHGIGKGEQSSTATEPLFSNVEGSLLTSLGKYRVGIRSYSKWGINVHYKLHGLEPSNSNAFRRIVVLHSFTPVSSEEIYPSHLPLGWSQGCPVIDDDTMRYLDNKFQNTSKPVLLWIYNGDA